MLTTYIGGGILPTWQLDALAMLVGLAATTVAIVQQTLP
jgi:hypothetical protein